MTTDPVARNRDLARRFIATINARDWDALDALTTDDVTRVSPSTPDVRVRNRDELKAFFREDERAVPDSVVEIRSMVADEHGVAIQATYRGTQKGPMGPFPASGRTVDLPFAGFIRIAGERITGLWAVWDNLGMLVQLGHIPPPGG